MSVVIEFGSSGIAMGYAGEPLPAGACRADCTFASSDGIILRDPAVLAAPSVPLNHAPSPWATAALNALASGENQTAAADWALAAGDYLSDMAERLGLLPTATPEWGVNAACVVPDIVLDNQRVFAAFAEALRVAGVRAFYPMRAAVCAAAEAGRPSAIVADFGYDALRVRTVVDGFQLATRGRADCAAAAGAAAEGRAAMWFEQALEAAVARGNQGVRGILPSSEGFLSPDGMTDIALPSALVAPSVAFNAVHVMNAGAGGDDAAAPARSSLPGHTSLLQNIPLPKLFTASLLQSAVLSNFTSSLAAWGARAASRDAMEAAAAVAPSTQPSAAISGAPASVVAGATVTFPDGTSVTLDGPARCAWLEPIFSASSTSADDGSTAAAVRTAQGTIVSAKQQLDGELRLTLPLICVGGLTRAVGFDGRLQAELRALDATYHHAVPHFPADPYPQWRGASFLATAASMEPLWVPTAAVAEEGAARILARINSGA